MSNPNNNKHAKWIPIVIFLLFANPVLIAPFAVFGGAYWIAHLIAKQRKSGGTARKGTFDECPQPFFCFHRDKGAHHVRRGREIDPWDRPDIDISKYQRNR